MLYFNDFSNIFNQAFSFRTTQSQQCDPGINADNAGIPQDPNTHWAVLTAVANFKRKLYTPNTVFTI